MSSTCQPLPTARVERIFERFALTYGNQKLASMWTGADPERVKLLWAEKLGAYPPDALAGAVVAVPDAHPSWPPTLGEFCELVRGKTGIHHRRALPVPRRSAEDIARGREHMDALRATLGRRRGAASRVPGEDDEPPPPPPACTCWTGLVRAETLCAACVTWRRNRDAVRMATDGTAEERAA